MKIDPHYKKGPTQNCKLPHCMGDPKNLFNAETFRGTICNECKAIHRYWEEDTIKENELNQNVQEEKPEQEYKLPKFNEEEQRKINRDYFLINKYKYKLKEKPAEQLDMFNEQEQKLKEE